MLGVPESRRAQRRESVAVRVEVAPAIPDQVSACVQDRNERESASDGEGPAALKNCHSAKLPAAEHPADCPGAAAEPREPQQVAARELLAYVEVGEPARKPLIRNIDHGPVGAAAGGVDRLAQGVCDVEVEAAEVPSPHHEGPAVKRRDAVGLAVADAAEARVEPVQPAIEQVPVEAVHVVDLVELPPARTDVVRLYGPGCSQLPLNPEEPVDRVLAPHERIVGANRRVQPWHSALAVQCQADVGEREVIRPLRALTERIDGLRRSILADAYRSDHGKKRAGVVEELPERAIVENPCSRPDRHLALAGRIPRDTQTRREVVLVGLVEAFLHFHPGIGDSLGEAVPAGERDVGEYAVVVIRFQERLPAQAQAQRKVRTDLPVVLDKPAEAREGRPEGQAARFPRLEVVCQLALGERVVPGKVEQVEEGVGGPRVHPLEERPGAAEAAVDRIPEAALERMLAAVIREHVAPFQVVLDEGGIREPLPVAGDPRYGDCGDVSVVQRQVATGPVRRDRHLVQQLRPEHVRVIQIEIHRVLGLNDGEVRVDARSRERDGIAVGAVEIPVDAVLAVVEVVIDARVPLQAVSQHGVAEDAVRGQRHVAGHRSDRRLDRAGGAARKRTAGGDVRDGSGQRPREESRCGGRHLGREARDDLRRDAVGVVRLHEVDEILRHDAGVARDPHVGAQHVHRGEEKGAVLPDRPAHAPVDLVALELRNLILGIGSRCQRVVGVEPAETAMQVVRPLLGDDVDDR